MLFMLYMVVWLFQFIESNLRLVTVCGSSVVESSFDDRGRELEPLGLSVMAITNNCSTALQLIYINHRSSKLTYTNSDVPVTKWIVLTTSQPVYNYLLDPVHFIHIIAVLALYSKAWFWVKEQWVIYHTLLFLKRNIKILYSFCLVMVKIIRNLCFQNSGGSRNFEKGGPAPKRGGPPPEIAKN
jgi:hypothetical protein